ncbi:NTP transferase domain-containing protein [Pseudalkalibacillus hwajinpoensis]|uniref:molybdenum cofactor guanylyltransferase n=1 Tax=Guptibacillus hwajinpoensis TaxID=208199 RepID=UPI00325BF237
MRLVGIILAGGPNGQHKSLLLYDKEPIIIHQIKEMSKLAGEIIIVTNTPRELLPFVPANIRIITDFYHNRGPLGGLQAGLSLARADVAWVIDVTNIFPSRNIAHKLLKLLGKRNADIALPLINNKLEPLQGVYRT